MKPFYLIVTRHRGEDYVEERPVRDLDWHGAVRLMQGGEIVGEVAAVVYVDVARGVSKDMGVPAAYDLARASIADRRPLPAQVAAFVAERGFDGYDAAEDDAAERRLAA